MRSRDFTSSRFSAVKRIPATLNASSTTGGSGTLQANGGSAIEFAYNASFFRRNDGTNDLCFDRARANAELSVWRYGTYSAADGSRISDNHTAKMTDCQHLG